MEETKCNICDEVIGDKSAVAQHLAGRNHAIKKKVAEFNEMNSLIRPSHQNERAISTVATWIRGLHHYDYLSTGRT